LKLGPHCLKGGCPPGWLDTEALPPVTGLDTGRWNCADFSFRISGIRFSNEPSHSFYQRNRLECLLCIPSLSHMYRDRSLSFAWGRGARRFLTSLGRRRHAMRLAAPSLSSSRANVLCGAAAFPRYEPLPLTPNFRNSKCVPNIASSALQQVETVRIAREGQFQCVVGVVASTVTINEPFQCRLDLDTLLAGQKGVRQMKEHVAVDHLCPTP
jgi:hypothetical protein